VEEIFIRSGSEEAEHRIIRNFDFRFSCFGVVM